jgi:hypothetical protein
MKKYLIFLIPLLWMQCEMVVDVDVPLETPKITINAIFNADSVWLVKLNKSKYVLDESDFQVIENAQVTINEDGQLYDILEYADYGIYKSRLNKKPEFGKNYEIEVVSSGLETVTAISSLPDTAVINNIQFRWEEGKSNDRNFNYAIDITMKDNPESENFYELTLYQGYHYVDWYTQDTVYQTYPIGIFTDDAAFNEGSDNEVIFDDKLFNGKDFTVTIKGNYYGTGNEDDKFILHIKSLSKDLFRYKITNSLQSSSSGDPFAQPVHVYNNIEKGFGVFAGYHEQLVEIEP